MAAKLGIVSAGTGCYYWTARICSRPYRGFALVVVDVASGGATRKLSAERRMRVSHFLWWRQIVGPMFMKMLIGHQFDDFRIEGRREQRQAIAAAPVDGTTAAQ